MDEKTQPEIDRENELWGQYQNGYNQGYCEGYTVCDRRWMNYALGYVVIIIAVLLLQKYDLLPLGEAA